MKTKLTAKLDLVAAYFLAKGSFDTARDNSIRLMVVNEAEADEFKRLAKNLARIAELIESSGYLGKIEK
jgi:hypothetical protein